MTLELSDSELIARILAGETALFELLMRRHNQTVYRVIRSVLRDDAEAEDVMQDAYVSAFAHLPALTASMLFSTWIRKIAFHEALRRVRRDLSSPFAKMELDMPDAPSLLPTPEAEATDAQLKVALERAIDALPDGFREVFMLRTVEGCSVSDTAEILGLHEEAVKTRLFRARGRLQDALSGWVERGAASSFAFPAVRCDRVVAAVLERLRSPRSPGSG